MHRVFEITGEYIELVKLLKATGLCATGGQAKISIQEGLATVDGETETRKGRKIKDGMTVKYGDHTIKVVHKKSSPGE